LRTVHAAIRAEVPMMLVDREVAGQLSAVDHLLPTLVETASAACGALR
jgi:hypothetical protein